MGPHHQLRGNIAPPHRPWRRDSPGGNKSNPFPANRLKFKTSIYQIPCLAKNGGDYNSAHQKRGGNSRGRLSFARHLYWYRKPLVDGQFRWKCSRDGGNFSFPGFDAPDGVSQGCFVVREGPHASHFDPRASAEEVATVRGDVISKSGAFGGVTPIRAVALSVAGAPEEATHTLPNSSHIERPAQNSI